MRKSLIIITFLLVKISTAFAQDSIHSTLSTLGRGKIKMTPDWTVLYMEVTVKNLNFNNAVQQLNSKASSLEKEITSAGFVKTDLKTTGYTVTKNIIYSAGTPIDSGFIASQTFLLEFSNDQSKIIKVVKTLTESKVGISFNFSFSLSEKKMEEAQNELLKNAVNDAHKRAKVLSQSSGVSLKKIIRIEYGKVETPNQPYAISAMAKSQTMQNVNFSGFTVNDLELTDQVTITWEVK